MIATELKLMGLSIRDLKKEISIGLRNKRYMGSEQYTLLCKQQEFRAEHIAYSLYLGRSYNQIEKFTHEYNKPNWTSIKNILLNRYGIILENGAGHA